LTPYTNGNGGWTRPWDWEQVSPGLWRVRGTGKHAHGEYQCGQCGIPIVTGRFCNDCTHYLANYDIPMERASGYAWGYLKWIPELGRNVSGRRAGEIGREVATEAST
jgi:hypothetical protein